MRQQYIVVKLHLKNGCILTVDALDESGSLSDALSKDPVVSVEVQSEVIRTEKFYQRISV